MAIIAKFTRTLPAPTATISGGFVFLLSAGWFTQADTGAAGSPIDGGANSIANGGGDMQIFSDAAATTRLPIQVVTFVTGGSPQCQVWVRTPSYTSGDTITIGKDDTQATQPAVGAAFGRNAAWVDFEVVIHQGTVIDSTGNHTPTLNGSPSLVAMNWGGQGYDFQLASQSITIPHSAGLNIERLYSIRIWNDVPVNNPSLGQQLIDKSLSNSDGFRLFKTNGTVTRQRSPNLSSANLDTVVSLNKVRESFVFDGTTRSSFSGVTNNGSDSPTGTVVNNTDDVTIALSGSGVTSLLGVLGDFWLEIGSSSGLDKISSEYANQNDPDNFGSSSEYILVGSSGISIAVTEVGPSFTESINTNLSVNITGAIVENGPAFTEAVNVTLTSLTLQASITETGPSFTESITATLAETLTINADIAEQGPSFTESITASLGVNIASTITELGPSFTESINISVIGDRVASIVENGPSFIESIIASIPITITVNPKNIIRVKRKDNTVIIKRKSNIIRVR